MCTIVTSSMNVGAGRAAAFVNWTAKAFQSVHDVGRCRRGRAQCAGHYQAAEQPGVSVA